VNRPSLLPAGTAQRATAVLRALNAAHPAIEASALMTVDGHMLATALTPAIQVDRFSAMCASLLALAARASGEAERGDLRQLVIDGQRGPMLLSRCGRKGVLAVAATQACPLGRLLVETQKALRDLTPLVDGAL
jgi:uncharacterized protein